MIINRDQGTRHESLGRRSGSTSGTRRRVAVALCVVFGWSCLSNSELRGSERLAGDFPELAAAAGPLEAFLTGNVVTDGPVDATPAFDSSRSCNPFPPDARILAYEEHRDFVFVLGDVSHVLHGGASGGDAAVRPQFIRRCLHLKPDLFVVDDFLRPAEGQDSVRWLVGCRTQPTGAGRQRVFADGDRELVWETLWPADQALQPWGEASEREPGACAVGLELSAAADGIRVLHVLSVRRRGGAKAAVSSSLKDTDGEFALTISTPQRTFRLRLPQPGTEAGSLAIHDAAGKALVPRRPLAAGILPHGPEGVRLIERWDAPYRDGRTASWDTGIVAPALKQAVESGALKPCRTISLGCGTGTNEIYLASQGFDVTAIDVAPTALGLAADKAEEAGVRVRWLLADVLAPPDLEPFDLVFDRGCYHNVRYVDAVAFVASLRRLTRPGAQCLVLSCNRDGPPGVREHHMRDDFSAWFDFVWLRDSGVESRDGSVRRESWSLLMRRKADSDR